MSVSLIHDLVRTGRLTPREGAQLLAFRREMDRRRSLPFRIVDAVTLGPWRRQWKAAGVITRAFHRWIGAVPRKAGGE